MKSRRVHRSVLVLVYNIIVLLGLWVCLIPAEGWARSVTVVPHDGKNKVDGKPYESWDG
jgi:hypothetical protein